eukprot:403332767
MSSNYASIDFEPSQYYLHEKKKHDYIVNNKCDRLKMFMKMNDQWKSDKFLSNNHVKHPNESREGRKLNLASYNQQYKKQEIVKKNPNNAPQYKLSSYVIQSERKRDDVRYEIRMKMLRANAMQIGKPSLTQDQRKRPKSASVKKIKKSSNISFNKI